MTEEELHLYFKDFKKTAQKRIRDWYERYEITGLEEIYSSKMPIQILIVFDESDVLPEVDHSKEMVS